MADLGKNRWSVTYTKHVKQKRKVYLDGFLEFHNSTYKIELYDDCQKLLCVRIAKEDEVIRSGETVAFNTYLVDIGDLEGGCTPMSNFNGQVRDNNATEKAGLLRPKKKFSPVFGSRKSNLENKAPSSCLSPSQKIIREFKKHEMLKYGGSSNSPDSTKPINSDWQVLYTTQKTQKAKKYHDGFLRIATCGSQARQATLYDLSRRVLDSKFLKKDEVVGSGESLEFDGHLVDVGDPERDYKPPSDTKAQAKSLSTVNENLAPGSSNLQVNGLTADKYIRREWHALYTNQITQKAKKYQSGFLTLASCGSYQLQATLVAEDGTVLTRNFLKLSEKVRSGSSFRLPNYLVEVVEARESPEGESPKFASAEREEKLTFCPTVDNSEPGKSDPVDKPLHYGESPRNAFFGRKGKSMLHPSVHSGPGNRDPVNKPLSGGEPPKDASSGRVPELTFHHISVRSEPGNCDSVNKPLRGDFVYPEVHGLIELLGQTALQYLNTSDNCSAVSLNMRANDILSILRKATTKQSSFPTRSIPMAQYHHSKLPDHIHPQFQNPVGRDVGDHDHERRDADSRTNGVLNSEDSEFRPESQSNYSSPSNSSMGEEVNDFLVVNFHGEHTSTSTLKPNFSAEELQVKLEPKQPLALGNGSSGHSEAFIESMFPKDGTSPRGYELPEELHTKTFAQPDEVAKMDIHHTSEIDEVPSFDLGF